MIVKSILSSTNLSEFDVVIMYRLIVRGNMGFFLKQFKFSRIWTFQSRKLMSHVMVGGLWMVSWAQFIQRFGLREFSVKFLLILCCLNSFWSAVFHVTDLDGNKLTDKRFISYIEQVYSYHFNSYSITYYVTWILYLPWYQILVTWTGMAT